MDASGGKLAFWGALHKIFLLVTVRLITLTSLRVHSTGVALVLNLLPNSGREALNLTPFGYQLKAGHR
jgi:hypothetical protein